MAPIHPLTGPVYVEEAEVGDILAVDILDIELHDYGWQAIVSGFGFLSDRFKNAKLSIHDIDKNSKTINFKDNVKIPLKPFPGGWESLQILQKCYQPYRREKMAEIWMIQE